MAWGFLDWVRGRPYRADAGELTLPRHPSVSELRTIALHLVDDARAWDAYKLLDGHSELACPVLEDLVREDERFRCMTGTAPAWGRPRFDAILTILLKWKSEYAIGEAVKLADHSEPSSRETAARLLASTGQSRFASILCKLASDAVKDVQTALAFGLSDLLQYGKRHGRTLEDELGRALFDFMSACALRTDRGPGNRFAAAMFRCDRARAVQDLAPDRALTMERNWLRDLVSTLNAEHVHIEPAIVKTLLSQAVAILDCDDFAISDHPGTASLAAELLSLLARTDPAAAKTQMRLLQQHHQPEARGAAQKVRSRWSRDPVEHVLRAMKRGGKLLALRREHRVVYLVWLLATEVGNGGWLQWVANSSGAHARETLDALRELGADGAAEELQKVVDILGPEGCSPKQSRRKAAIDRMMTDNRSLPDDGVIWRMNADLQSLMYDYAELDPSFFF
jgi:hypothetical protein